ncbi:MAG: exodeoxyribonuclease VII small subunit [Caldilineales bacterium]
MDQLTFEQAYTELEQITRQLEAGDLPLDAALHLFEQGTRLAAHCEQMLSAAELRVRQIVPDAAGGYEAADFSDWQQEAR